MPSPFKLLLLRLLLPPLLQADMRSIYGRDFEAVMLPGEPAQQRVHVQAAMPNPSLLYVQCHSLAGAA